MLVKPKEEEANYSPKEEDIPPFRPLVPDSVKGGEGTFGPTPEERALDKKLREGDNVREFPTVVTADRIEYFYRKGERRATITGNPQARQEFAKTRWRQVWTHTALYDGEAETLRLTSRDGKMETRFKNSIGDDLVAKAVLSTPPRATSVTRPRRRGAACIPTPTMTKPRRPNRRRPAAASLTSRVRPSAGSPAGWSS